jgi:hypothetical protein
MAPGHTMDIEVFSEGYLEKFPYIFLSYLWSEVDNSLLYEYQQLTDGCSFSNVCPSCQRNRPPAGKTHVTISLEQMDTCTQLPTAIKQENSNLIWKVGVSDLYPCTVWQVHSLSSHLLDCLVRDLNYGPSRLHHTLCLCVLCGSENIQRVFPYTALTDWFL